MYYRKNEQRNQIRDCTLSMQQEVGGGGGGGGTEGFCGSHGIFQANIDGPLNIFQNF